jgi:hypothetical protein
MSIVPDRSGCFPQKPIIQNPAIQQLTMTLWSVAASLDFRISWGWDVMSALMTTGTMEMGSKSW